MNYELFPKVYNSGFANTGITSVINDRNTVLTVPWAVPSSQRGNKNITWSIKSDNGSTYTVTVPVAVAVDGNSTTVTYTKGTVRIGGS